MAKGKAAEWKTDEGLTILEGWARDGLTDEQIAHNIGINRTTLYDWKKKHEDIDQALKSGKEVIDRQVENALLTSALGFNYQEQTVTNAGEVVSLQKYEKPNATAIIFWLKNRKPDTWKDKQEVKQDGVAKVEIVDDVPAGDEDDDLGGDLDDN